MDPGQAGFRANTSFPVNMRSAHYAFLDQCGLGKLFYLSIHISYQGGNVCGTYNSFP